MGWDAKLSEERVGSGREESRGEVASGHGKLRDLSQDENSKSPTSHTDK